MAVVIHFHVADGYHATDVIHEAVAKANIDSQVFGMHYNRIKLRDDISLSELEAVVGILYVSGYSFSLMRS